jgi:hypothetical protein
MKVPVIVFTRTVTSSLDIKIFCNQCNFTYFILLAPIPDQHLEAESVVMVLVADEAVVTLILRVVIIVREMVVVDVLNDFEAKFNLFISLLCMRKLFPDVYPVLPYSCQHTL